MGVAKPPEQGSTGHLYSEREVAALMRQASDYTDRKLREQAWAHLLELADMRRELHALAEEIRKLRR